MGPSVENEEPIVDTELMPSVDKDSPLIVSEEELILNPDEVMIPTTMNEDLVPTLDKEESVVVNKELNPTFEFAPSLPAKSPTDEEVFVPTLGKDDSLTGDKALPIPDEELITTEEKEGTPIRMELVPSKEKEKTPIVDEEMRPNPDKDLKPTSNKEMLPTVDKEVIPTDSEELVPIPLKDLRPTLNKELITTLEAAAPFSTSPKSTIVNKGMEGTSGPIYTVSLPDDVPIMMKTTEIFSSPFNVFAVYILVGGVALLLIRKFRRRFMIC